MQTSRANNSRILRIKNAKFSVYCYYINTNILGDFQICISVPLSYFALNSRFSFLLTIFFNNLNKLFWRNTLLRVTKSQKKKYLSCISWWFILLNTFDIKILRWSAENRCIKRLHVYKLLKKHVIFILQHVDWVLCILSKCNWMYNF